MVFVLERHDILGPCNAHAQQRRVRDRAMDDITDLAVGRTQMARESGEFLKETQERQIFEESVGADIREHSPRRLQSSGW